MLETLCLMSAWSTETRLDWKLGLLCREFRATLIGGGLSLSSFLSYNFIVSAAVSKVLERLGWY